MYINRPHGSFIASVVDVNIFDCLMSVRLLVLKQTCFKSRLMIDSQHLSKSILG